MSHITIDASTLITLIDGWEAQTEKLKNRRIPGKRQLIEWRESVSNTARTSLEPDAHKVEGSYDHFNRYIAGDR